MTPSIRVLVVEDDPTLAEGATATIARMGCDVVLARGGESASALIVNEDFDLMVLDIGLPGIDGLRLLEQVRRNDSKSAVILLTARDSLEDRIRGLDLGADDYLVKPIALEELAARVRARLRSARLQGGEMVRYGPIALDGLSRRATANGQELELTAREWELLDLLLRRAEQVVAKESLQQRLVGDSDSGYNAVEVYVSRLRAKLEAHAVRIRTVRGIGYRLEAAQPDPAPGRTA